MLRSTMRFTVCNLCVSAAARSRQRRGVELLVEPVEAEGDLRMALSVTTSNSLWRGRCCAPGSGAVGVQADQLECGLHFRGRHAFARDEIFRLEDGDDRPVIVFRQQTRLRSYDAAGIDRNERSRNWDLHRPCRDQAIGPALVDGDVDAVGQHTLDDRALDLRHLLDGGRAWPRSTVKMLRSSTISAVVSTCSRVNAAVGGEIDFVQIVVGIFPHEAAQRFLPAIPRPGAEAAKKTVLRQSRTPRGSGANARCSRAAYVEQVLLLALAGVGDALLLVAS